MAEFPNLQNLAEGATPTWVTDPENGNYLKPNADGSVNIAGNFAVSAAVSAVATGAAPTYTEGCTTAPFSQDLHGNLRVKQLDALHVTGSVTSAAVILSQDTTGYNSVAIQLTSVGVGCTISFEARNSSGWEPIAGYLSDASKARITDTTDLGLYFFPTIGLEFRARVSTYGSGTVAADAEFRNASITPPGAGGGTGADVNVAEVGGNAVSVDVGGANVGTQRVVLANDQVVAVSVSSGNLTSVASVGNILAGNIAVTGNIANVGTVGSVTNIANGNLASVAVIGSILNLVNGNLSAVAVVGSVSNVANGNLTNVATIGNILAGNVAVSGNITNVGTVGSVTNIANGNLTGITTVGTVASVSNIVTGNLASVTTVTQVANLVNGNLTAVATVGSVTNIANGNLTAVASITNNVKVVGPTASDVAVSTAPVTIGGLAKTSLPTAVGDGNVTNAILSKYGQLIVRQSLREQQVNQYTTISNTSETTIITADASNKLDVTALTFTSDTQVSITIRDGTAGTIKDKYTLQGNTSGGFVSSGLPKLIQAAANNNWTAQLSATANVSVSATFIKAGP